MGGWCTVLDSLSHCLEGTQMKLSLFFTLVVTLHITMQTLLTSVADPGPDPSDPQVFGPPGSKSGSITYLGILVSWRSMMKIAGSESASGSINQRHGSADPDPHQNVMDPQHCFCWHTDSAFPWSLSPVCGVVSLWFSLTSLYNDAAPGWQTGPQISGNQSESCKKTVISNNRGISNSNFLKIYIWLLFFSKFDRWSDPQRWIFRISAIRIHIFSCLSQYTQAQC